MLNMYYGDIIDLQSGEYRHRYGVGGEEGDETKHSIYAALHLKIIRMIINDNQDDVNQDKGCCFSAPPPPPLKKREKEREEEVQI